MARTLARTPQHGVLIKWNEESGYGFIRPDSGEKEVFAHIRDFVRRHARPRVGDRIDYQLGKDREGRICAKQVRREGTEAPAPFSVVAAAFGLCCLMILGVQVRRGVYPAVLIPVLAGLSLFSYHLYREDKIRALKKRYRIPEVRLHLLDLAGGWPGGWAAQRRFRHKISKPGFQALFYGTVALNLLILHYLGANPGYWKNGSFAEYLPALQPRIEGHLREWR
jgi:uncharacterized membrane protein YsdA (DUF1294 family)/cold shock CspA family protein